jgi:hypothetical protein
VTGYQITKIGDSSEKGNLYHGSFGSAANLYKKEINAPFLLRKASLKRNKILLINR